MGFFDKIKAEVSSATKKVGSFMKNALKESEEQAAERREKEAKEQVEREVREKEEKRIADLAKTAEEKAKLEAEKKAEEEKLLREEKVKQELLKQQLAEQAQKEKLAKMERKIDNEKSIDIKSLLRELDAMDEDGFYVAGNSTLNDKSSMTKFLKKDKDKVYLSISNGYFYVSRYMSADKIFRTYKCFKKQDVSTVTINDDILDKHLEIKDKEGFYLIRIDVTDNGKALSTIKSLLQ